MSDHFTELDLARAAWIEAEEVKSQHHRLMTECHADKSTGDGDRATRLNEARRVLENPASRLRHLLELEFPNFESTQKPEPDWDLFSRTGAAAKRATQAAATLNSATSPLARAVASIQAAETRKNLLALQDELTHKAAHLKEKTRSIPLAEPQALSDLAEEWTYLNRWKSVIHEALSALGI